MTTYLSIIQNNQITHLEDRLGGFFPIRGVIMNNQNLEVLATTLSAQLERQV